MGVGPIFCGAGPTFCSCAFLAKAPVAGRARVAARAAAARNEVNLADFDDSGTTKH
jgi:hypothetical protein